jgi:hypothetical protein
MTSPNTDHSAAAEPGRLVADLRLFAALLRGRTPALIARPRPDGAPGTRNTAEQGWLGEQRLSLTVDCALVVLAVAACAVSVAQPHGVSRLLLVLTAACLIPGSAVLTRLTVEDFFEAVVIAVGLGFCLEAAGGLAMVWTGLWHPFAWALILLAGSVGALLLDIRRMVVAARSPSAALDARVGTA